jgi:hypothetical protein
LPVALQLKSIASSGDYFRAVVGFSTSGQLMLVATHSPFETKASQSVNWITSGRFVSYVQAYQPIALGLGIDGKPARISKPSSADQNSEREFQ